MTEWSRPAVAAMLAECGRIALRYYDKPRISIKSDSTVVTEADHAVEALFASELDRPGKGSWLIGEETVASRDEGYIQAALAGTAWVVDPIDGTAPYSRHIPTWGISVALARAGALVEGAILLPTTHELFMTEAGRLYYGQSDDGIAGLRDVTDLPRAGDALDDHGLIAITQETAKRGRVNLPTQVQALATAVFPMTYLCLGRYEGYVGSLKLWDFAGAMPMLAARGVVVAFPGRPIRDLRIAGSLCHVEAGHPARWRALGPLVAGRSAAIVERLCAAITIDGRPLGEGGT
jgi:myo-inositol-1(or 4)-monophosphatase